MKNTDYDIQELLQRDVYVNQDYIPEEGYDILRDMGKLPPTKGKKDATTMPRSSQPQKPTKGKSALDIVKADIRKKYGKDAIMDVGKNNASTI